MSFRVIEGGAGRTLPRRRTGIMSARAAIIDRVAAAIWANHDRDPAYASWAEMKSLAAGDAARSHLVSETIAQARAAVGALIAASPPEDECEILSDLGLDPESAADAMMTIDDYLKALLDVDGQTSPCGEFRQ